jgi:predicted dinucleotide-utilizing enzyme
MTAVHDKIEAARDQAIREVAQEILADPDHTARVVVAAIMAEHYLSQDKSVVALDLLSGVLT